MALGFAGTIAAELLDALFNSDAYDGPAQIFMKLHIGDPGVAGASNAAVETDRIEVTFGVASSGAISNDAQIQWTTVAGAEDYTHWSLWDASTAGNFLFSGTMTANAVQINDTFTIPTGDLDITLNAAA